MKTRRGLSSVVGMVFAIVAFTTTLVYVSYSMNTLNQFDQTVLTKNQGLADANKEKFQIANVNVAKSKLNITLVNTGPIPLNFTKIWVKNTTATNWVNGYVPGGTTAFASPGAILTNLGQQIPLYINQGNSYNVKLVTSRGTNQAFSINSPNTAPLNIQMMFLPPTVASGFKSELMMIVINNSTGTLTNITPSSLPSPTYGSGNSGNLQCTASAANPPKYNTLGPGNVAVFTWDITTSGGNGGDTCTYSYTSTPPLQNGYLQSVAPPSPLTITVINLSSTTYAQNSGIVTMSYTSFNWIQSNTWYNGWQFPNGVATAFQVTLANNNQTAGGYYLNMSQHTQILLTPTLGNTAASAHVPYAFFIVNAVNTNTNPYTLTSYNDYSQGIANQGAQRVLYFAGVTAGGNSQPCNGNNNNCLPPGEYYGLLLIYGKYTKSGAFTGSTYAQTLPFFAVVAN